MFTAGQRIHLEWGNRRFESRIRGWKKDCYILVDMEYDSEDFAGIQLGHELVARFIKDGMSYGFVASPSQFLYDHHIAVLAYPEQIELHKEKQIRWFPVSSPVYILQALAGHELEDWRCVARELSLSGLRVISNHAVKIGDKLFITFDLVTGEKVENIHVAVERVSKAAGGFKLELKYIFLSDDNKQALDNFVDMASTRSGLHR